MRERKTFISFGAHADPSIDYLVGILEDARVTTLHGIAVTLTEFAELTATA